MTGPQGSGNHLWSKVFAAAGNCFAWSELNNNYWVAHDKEPFAEAWNNASKLKDIDIGDFCIAVTSISCPYAYHGNTVEPDYKSFISTAKKLGYNIRVAIIGRDANILEHQQQRVRNTFSLPKFEKHLDFLSTFSPIFLSTELLYLYKLQYIKQIERDLHFRIPISKEKLKEILTPNANTKYFKPAGIQPLDKIVKQVSGIKF